MKINNLRGVTRNASFLAHGKKMNYNGIVASMLVSGVVKSTYVKKRPRWANWFAGKNKF